jgi:hypothetical protein
MLPSLPTHVYGIPLWAILFGVAGLILFFLKMSTESANQDRYPTTKLFLYIGVSFVGVVGVVDFIRWANLW